MALVDFIIKAKISGYASGGEDQKRKFDDGSLGFEFVADGYKYLDRYYGFNPFSGSEHVYDGDDSLICNINYFGRLPYDWVGIGLSIVTIVAFAIGVIGFYIQWRKQK